MIHIFSDSCCDLSAELIERYQIHIIRLSVFINNQTYRDGDDITPADIYQFVAQSGTLPKTSAPSVAAFIEFFKQVEGEIVFIGISAKLSATLHNAILAAGMLPERKIHIVDSKNLSTGIGLLVLKAAELRDEGRTAEEIVAKVKEAIGQINTSFTIDTLEYLHKGGRCSAMENVVGSLLKIRPVIEVRPDGTLGVKEKTRGTRKKALNYMVENFRANLHKLDLHRVFITHTGCNQDAEYLKTELERIAAVENLHITVAGCTVTSHCGPNTIGILYFTAA